MTIKKELLSYLEENRGNYVSGRMMAQKLNCSRAGIWKAVNVLKDEGYQIKATNKLGYLLEDQDDKISAKLIKSKLKEEIADLLVFPEVGSTNDVAREMAQNKAPSKTIIIAEYQTAGRGRLGRTFSSPKSSGLYMSIILRPENPVEQAMLLTSLTGVAVCRAIERVSQIECKIKWVNDVFCNGKKLCGISNEASMNFEYNTLEYVIIGIGINTLGKFVNELKDIATTISECAGASCNRNDLAAAVINELFALLPQLEGAEFIDEYRKRSCIIGKHISVISPNSTRQAEALDITDRGFLVVKYNDGTIAELNSGEISIRPA